MTRIDTALEHRINQLLEMDLPSEEDVAAREEQQREMLAHNKAVRALAADIGDRHRVCKVSGYEVYDDDQKALKDRCVEIGQNIRHYASLGKSLFLYGSPGCGKDHLAIALLKQGVNQGLTCRWVLTQQLYRTLYQSPARGHEEEKSLYWPDIVCLSDPVLEATTEPQRAALFRIVDARMIRGLGTWVTCNIPLRAGEEIKDKAGQLFGEQTLSRLLEHADRFGCTWEDYRTR